MGGVAGEAGLVLRLIDWLAVDESPESSPSGGSIPFRIFDYELKRCGGAGNEALPSSEGGIILRGRNTLPGNLCEDRAVWKRERTFPIRFHRDVVSEFRPQLVEASCFLGRCNQLPLPESNRDCDT
jgi:hypothetical protein